MHVTSQLVILSAIFLLTVGIGDAMWVVFAGSVRGCIEKIGKLRNRIAGGFLDGLGHAWPRQQGRKQRLDRQTTHDCKQLGSYDSISRPRRIV